MLKESAQQILAALSAARGASGAMSEQLKIDDGIVGERIGLQPGPQVFDGVKFRGVRRQVFQVRRMGRHAFVNESALVSLEAIPDEHDGGAQLPLKMFEEVHRAFGIDVGVRVQSKVQREAVACGRNAQRSDDGDLLITATPLSQQRCVAAQAPGATHQRRHEHAGFVDEYDRGSQARGVFFTRGQSCSIQARMRSSSRSIARRVGFCGEKPRPWSMRLTCAG